MEDKSKTSVITEVPFTALKYLRDNPVFKFVILGDSGCGKTSILHHFLFSKCKFIFLIFYLVKKEPRHTISVEFSAKVVNINNKDIRLQLWDTAGQEKYRAVTKSYYRGAHGVLIVYDVTKPESLQHVSGWLADARAAALKDCTICVVGNKNDLKDQRIVQYNDGAKFCQENSINNIF